mmetsp:Transcript_38679/g.109342  ORF Transcript_38679/g.109342 Transcript_38679/m.109342 type:complete len:204 (+) Transcript_38679:852-1463(+)
MSTACLMRLSANKTAASAPFLCTAVAAKHTTSTQRCTTALQRLCASHAKRNFGNVYEWLRRYIMHKCCMPMMRSLLVYLLPILFANAFAMQMETTAHSRGDDEARATSPVLESPIQAPPTSGEDFPSVQQDTFPARDAAVQHLDEKLRGSTEGGVRPKEDRPSIPALRGLEQPKANNFAVVARTDSLATTIVLRYRRGEARQL